MSFLENLKKRGLKLRTEVFTLYLASRHPETPWYAKFFIIGIVAYALSPIDLIPDFIPVIGYLDDLILIPLGIIIAIKIIPIQIMVECRAQAQKMSFNSKPNWKAGSTIILLWLILSALLVAWILKAI